MPRDYPEYEDESTEETYRDPLKPFLIALVVLLLLFAAIIVLLYMRLQTANTRAETLSQELTAVQVQLDDLRAQRAAETPTPTPTEAPTPTPEPTPEPTATPEPTPEPTPTSFRRRCWRHWTALCRCWPPSSPRKRTFSAGCGSILTEKYLTSHRKAVRRSISVCGAGSCNGTRRSYESDLCTAVL